MAEQGPRAASLLLRPLVAPPAQLVGAALGGGDDVGPLVAVEVGDDHLVCPRPSLLQLVHRPLALRIAGVLEPDQATVSAPGRGNDVQLAVAVEVGGERLEGVIQVADYVLL